MRFENELDYVLNFAQINMTVQRFASSMHVESSSKRTKCSQILINRECGWTCCNASSCIRAYQKQALTFELTTRTRGFRFKICASKLLV